MSDDWKEIKPNLFEHANGNWVWRVGNAYEVWYRVCLQHKYGGTTADREIARNWAEKGQDASQ